MLSGALATLIAALLMVAASCGAGAGILAACGRRRWSWAAPAVGLGAITIVAWWAVRLPGHGWTALALVAALGAAGAVLGAARLDGLGSAARAGLPLAAGALLVACVPFAAEGHFGVLGTGFNVDMSQHLFAASWVADPEGPTPGLYEQGYPLGPHALAVAAESLTGELTLAFSGLTIALPAIIALSSLVATSTWPRPRAWAMAGLVGFAYLAASLLVQGSFKELFEIAFLVGAVALLLEREEPGCGAGDGWREGIPFALLGAGALYAYSSPGLAWPLGAVVLWGGIELLRRPRDAGALLRLALAPVAAGFVALALFVAPEIDRIADFGGSVGTVTEGGRAEAAPRLTAQRGDADSGGSEQPDFNDELGNLFGQISPLEALNVWPSGDFRVAPGDGAVPAPVFWLGALLGAVALAAGALMLIRRSSTALLAGLAAALAIWLAARVGSTPYTTAKALAIAAPLTMAVSLRGLLAPGDGAGARPLLPALLLTAAFAVAAAGSSLLALASAPVGPRDYSPDVRLLSEEFAGAPTLLLAPADVIADERGREFFSWEIREARPGCVEAEGYTGSLEGIQQVVTTGGVAFDPPAGVEATSIDEGEGTTLWRLETSGPPPQGGRFGACAFSGS